MLIDRPEAHNALSPAVLDGLDAAPRHRARQPAAACSCCAARAAASRRAPTCPTCARCSATPPPSRPTSPAIGAVLDRHRGRARSSRWPSSTGYALAGGCEILLACDLAVVADEARDRRPTPGVRAAARRGRLGAAAARAARPARPAVALHRRDDRRRHRGDVGPGQPPRPGRRARRRGRRARRPAGPAQPGRAGRDEGDVPRRAGRRRPPPRWPPSGPRCSHTCDSPTAAEGLAAFAGHRPPDFSRRAALQPQAPEDR